MHVAVYAFDGITHFHLAAPLLVFGEMMRLDPDSGVSISVWSSTGDPVSTYEGLKLTDLRGQEAVADADLLILPSWPHDLPAPDSSLTQVIRAAHARGATVAGLCLGAFPVAASGMLDGRTATTHWQAAEQFAIQFPQVDVRAEALYLDHGDVITSAGTASAIDACLHLVRSRYGAERAATIARSLVVAPHREGDQAQYIDRPVSPVDASPIGETTAWALAHLDEPLTVETLAQHARMSPRNFSRRFSQVTGLSPAKWLLARRLDEARRLLETTSWSIARVARTCGFGSVVTFRQNFVSRYATTPTSYRTRFNRDRR